MANMPSRLLPVARRGVMSLYDSLRRIYALSRMMFLFKIKDECPITCWRSIAPWTRKDLADLSVKHIGGKL